MRVAGYTRVSTDEQAREGYSLAAQDEAIRAYCVAHRWELGDIYTDAGRSGKSTKGRDALAALIAAAEAGVFERLIFWKLDRLGRNLRDLLEISDRLEAVGVGIVSIQESIDTGTASGRMLRNVIGSLAEFEREVIVERIKFGIEQKAHEGKIVGPVSLGYQRDEEGNLAFDSNSDQVHELFERYASGSYSLRQLAQWAESVGLRSRNGNVLDRLSIRKILTNNIYVGDVAFHRRGGGGTVSPGTHPSLVDRELFEDVQRQLVHRQREQPTTPWGKEPYPLTQVAHCGYCGAPLVGSRASKNQRRYMRCSTTARIGRQACAQPMVLADVMEAQIGAYVEGMQLPLEYVQAVIGELRDRHQGLDNAHEIQKIEKALDGWRRLFVIGDIDEARYKRETAPLRQRVKELESQSRSLDMVAAIEYIHGAGGLWRESERRTQREFVVEVFDRIVVEGAQVKEIVPKSEYSALFKIDRTTRFRSEGGVIWLPDEDSNLEPSG